MKKILGKTIILVIVYLMASNLLAQPSKYIYIAGGVNHIPVEGFFRFPSSEFNRAVDQISFSGSIGVLYTYNNKSEFSFGIEYISTNAGMYYGYGSTNWIMKSIPITLGYNYFIYRSENWFDIYSGVGISFVLIDTEWNYIGDADRDEINYTNKTYGAEVRCGIIKSIAQDLNLFVEAKYRLHGDVEVNKTNPGGLVNFSGIAILAGFSINVFN